MPTGPTGLNDLLPTAGTLLVGDVAEFDEDRGLGVVEYGEGRRLPFHCTAITDGSRRVDVGAVVAFMVAAGRLGQLEARSVRPLPGVVRPGSTLVHGDTWGDRDPLSGGRSGEPAVVADSWVDGSLDGGVDGEAASAVKDSVPTGAAQMPVGPGPADPVGAGPMV